MTSSLDTFSLNGPDLALPPSAPHHVTLASRGSLDKSKPTSYYLVEGVSCFLSVVSRGMT